MILFLIVNNVKREKNQDSSIVFLGPDRIDDKPDWNIKTLHRRMEDKIERDVEGYIGFMPKDDEVTMYLYQNEKGVRSEN